MKELYSIVDYTLSTGAHPVPIDTNFFPNWPGPNLWTSTTSLAPGLNAFVVSCGLCNASFYGTGSGLNVLLVRSGQADATFDLTGVIFRNGFD
jgi:hypothetical protein